MQLSQPPPTTPPPPASTAEHSGLVVRDVPAVPAHSPSNRAPPPSAAGPPTLAVPQPVVSSVSLAATTLDDSAPAPAEKGAAEEGPVVDSASAAKVRGEPFDLVLLLVSGKRRKWVVGSEETVREVRERVWREWPEEWHSTEDVPPTAKALRLLYLGRFLEDSALLSSYGLKPSPDAEGPTIVHLHIRTLMPIDGSEAPLKPKKSTPSCRCCVVS
ncbi:hypothetical protein JCM1841_002883 [Sporobolomyces salmonicolor]